MYGRGGTYKPRLTKVTREEMRVQPSFTELLKIATDERPKIKWPQHIAISAVQNLDLVTNQLAPSLHDQHLRQAQALAVPSGRDGAQGMPGMPGRDLSLIHISEPTRLGMISYAVFC